MRTLPIFSDKKCSTEFISAFGHNATTLQAWCSACGRTHFLDSEISFGTYDSGEFEALQKQAREKPKQYIFHPTREYLHYIEVGKKQLVLECECGYAKLIEDWLISNSEWIKKFYETLEERFPAQKIATSVEEFHLGNCTH